MMIEVDGVGRGIRRPGRSADPADPPILLIMGMGGSGDYWEPDHRDTGRSVTYPPGEPGYLESSARNHHAAPGGGGSWRHRLPEITAPTLAREIPGARLVELPATGHEFPRENWSIVVREVLTLAS